ncbi:hypothetical protein [Virgibacillus salinus]|uniref:Uncharacterized protein n=1 Tax=Virgibacillus salinus TaxID=553311 RepID=A0A1H1GHG4_9BACI|nr:hypothetical protein [Virgibacillus salinus]SDR12650.1 hypothetical protein SAMN05216231_3729 [Virgibacillus salinus]
MGFDYSRFEYELNNIIEGYNLNPKYEFMKLDKCMLFKALLKGIERKEPLGKYIESNITYHPGEIPYSTYASAFVSYALEQIEKDFFDHYKDLKL